MKFIFFLPFYFIFNITNDLGNFRNFGNFFLCVDQKTISYTCLLCNLKKSRRLYF